jgi:FlaA1/EpsC-like NDP-sugar epimerase
LGYVFTGFINTHQQNKNYLNKSLPLLGDLHDMEQVIKQHDIKQVIIALEDKESHLTDALLQRLSEVDVEVKLYPNTKDIIAGSVKTC